MLQALRLKLPLSAERGVSGRHCAIVVVTA